MRAAEQILFVEFTLAQKRRGRRYVYRLAAMRRARQRDLFAG